MVISVIKSNTYVLNCMPMMLYFLYNIKLASIHTCMQLTDIWSLSPSLFLHQLLLAIKLFPDMISIILLIYYQNLTTVRLQIFVV